MSQSENSSKRLQTYSQEFNMPEEDNRNVARMCALLAGFPVETPAVTYNRLCASGLHAVVQAARAIKVGDGEVYIGGGLESMSRAPYSVPKAETGYPFGNLTAWDTALGWRYPNPRLKEMYGNDSLGETAENIWDMTVAAGHAIPREEQDRFSLQSHLRAIAAMDAGKFKDEIIPVEIPQPRTPYGLATLCVGVGQEEAMIVEWIGE
jgi:acetyl-CoA acyltransferase